MDKLAPEPVPPFHALVELARSDPELTRRYGALIDATVEAPDTRPNLFRVDVPQLVAWNALLSLAVDPAGTVVAGAHAVIEGRSASVQGVVTTPSVRLCGIATHVVATLIVALHDRYGVTDFHATVRLFGGDEPNRLVWPLFRKLAFIAVQPLTIAVIGSPVDAHLDDGSGTFRALSLRGGAPSIRAARKALELSHA